MVVSSFQSPLKEFFRKGHRPAEPGNVLYTQITSQITWNVHAPLQFALLGVSKPQPPQTGITLNQDDKNLCWHHQALLFYTYHLQDGSGIPPTSLEFTISQPVQAVDHLNRTAVVPASTGWKGKVQIDWGIGCVWWMGIPIMTDEIRINQIVECPWMPGDSLNEMWASASQFILMLIHEGSLLSQNNSGFKTETL